MAINFTGREEHVEMYLGKLVFPISAVFPIMPDNSVPSDYAHLKEIHFGAAEV